MHASLNVLQLGKQDEISFPTFHLCADERKHLGLLVKPCARANFSFGRLLAKRLLAERLAIPINAIKIRQSLHGKPYLQDYPSLHFNLSHTHGLIVCVISESGPIGVDVEDPNRTIRSEAVWPRFFSPEEIAWLERHTGSHRQRAFLRLWTLKEAVMKADGRGLHMGLGTVKFDMHRCDRFQLLSSAEINANQWQVRSGVIASYPWAVACATLVRDYAEFDVSVVWLTLQNLGCF